ncbi:MAG: DNA-protecting protein DprA, partial [Actinomycetota bacterium]|nr:DNA-protecting protein DprA [Actinomycetota bacterium]
TRRPSLDGLRTAHRLGRLLAGHGVVVVSGLARGIDQAAHRGALDAGGATIAVLGAGLDVDYPAGSARLRAAVAAAGGVVSEHLPGTPPRPGHFLWRNRIISGLADATVVVEGRQRSGALQTARLAAAQGREVLAVPGSLSTPTSRAPLDLIRDGARPVTRLEDVLDAVGVAWSPAAEDEDSPARDLNPTAAAVLDLLGSVPTTAGALADRTGFGVGQVLAALGELTVRGLAEATPGGIVRILLSHASDRGVTASSRRRS